MLDNINNDLNNRSIFDGFTNLGGPARGGNLVSNYFGPKDEHRGGDWIPGTEIIKNTGEHDINETIVTQPYHLADSELWDDDAFTGADQYKVNPQPLPTYQDWVKNLTEEEREELSFLGINFKKIGNGIGHAARSVGLSVAHTVRDGAVDVAHGARAAGLAVAHVARDGSEDVLHGVRDLPKDLIRYKKWEHKNFGKALHWYEQSYKKNMNAIYHAVRPYWREIAAAVVVAVLCYTGVGIAVAAPIGGAIIGGLDAVDPPGAKQLEFNPNSLGEDPSGDAPGDPTDPDAGLDEGEASLADNIADNEKDDIQDVNYLPEPDPEYMPVPPEHHYTRWIIAGLIVIGLAWWWIKRKK